MEQSLKGKTALVTGASRGIGRAIAERLAKDGATVALTYNTSKSGADEAVAAIERAGGTAFAIHADLVDPATIPTLFERLDDEFTKRNGSCRHEARGSRARLLGRDRTAGHSQNTGGSRQGEHHFSGCPFRGAPECREGASHLAGEDHRRCDQRLRRAP